VILVLDVDYLKSERLVMSKYELFGYLMLGYDNKLFLFITFVLLNMRCVDIILIDLMHLSLLNWRNDDTIIYS
jgi:hypothetical protein